jgi:hypothetical protein
MFVYHTYLNVDKCELSPKSQRWFDISVDKMKRFVAIIILMVQVKKDRYTDFLSASPLTAAPVFGKLVSRNRGEQTWNYSDNTELNDETDGLYKVTRSQSLHITCYILRYK